MELADYCNLKRDIDQRILNDLLMSKMVLKYIESILANKCECPPFPSVNWWNKLKSYKRFKFEYDIENYCKVLVPFKDFSAFAKFMCGVAPIRLETGNYENIKRKKDAVLTVQL